MKASILAIDARSSVPFDLSLQYTSIITRRDQIAFLAIETIHKLLSPTAIHYHAILANTPSGKLLTNTFLTSSMHKIPRASGKGKNQNSSGIEAVPNRL